MGSIVLGKGVEDQQVAAHWGSSAGRSGHNGAQCQPERPPFYGGTRSNGEGQESRKPKAVSQDPG